MRIIQRYEFQHPLFQSMLLNMEENYCRYHEPSEYDKIYTQHAQGKIFSVKYHVWFFIQFLKYIRRTLLKEVQV